MKKLYICKKNLSSFIFHLSSPSGQSLIELLLAIAFAGIIIPVIFGSFITSREGKSQENQRLLALPLLQDMQETMRIIREKDWNAFAVNGTYFPSASGSSIILTSGTETKDNFFRNVTIEDVYRNSLGTIISTGGTVDPSTKKIVSSVWWTQPYISTISATMYLTRHLADQTYSQTSQTDFNAGTKTNISVTSTGEVTLAAGGNADWCAPQGIVSSTDLPKNGVANAISAIEGRVFAGTGDNSSGISFANISISNTSSPSGTLIGTFDGYKTNGVFGETNYAYLATDTNSKEIVIVDLTHKDGDNKYSEVGNFNTSDNESASSVFVSGTMGYMVDANKFYTFDLTSKIGSRPLLKSITLGGIGTNLKIVGNYAYVSLNSTPQLQVIKISPDGKTLTIVGQASVNGLGSLDVVINNTATRAYLATRNSATQKEFFIVDISPADPPAYWPFPNYYSTVGSYEANGMNPKGIAVVNTNRAIIVGTSGEQYQVINIANESNPVRCGGLNIATGINGVSSVLEADSDAYSYIISGDASSELKIIRGGPGGGQHALSGTFESSAFISSASAAFNSFNATTSQPAQTTIALQVAVANAIGNSCSGVTFDYRGPDGTGSTYFNNSGTIPVLTNGNYANPGRCFRYKAYLSTTDQNATPTLYDMTVNYSP